MMARWLTTCDVSVVAAYRRRLDRAAVAGMVYGILVLLGLAAPALQTFNLGRGLLWLVVGVAIALWSLLLQKGNRVAASLLAAALVVGVMWLALSWQRLPAGIGTMIFNLALLAVGPIVYFLGSGIVAVYMFEQSRSTEHCESGDFTSFPAFHQSGQDEWTGWSDGMALITFWRRFSETAVLLGAAMLLIHVLLGLRGTQQIEWLLLAGVACLVLGVHLSLRVERRARKKRHEWLVRERRPPVLLLQSAGDELLKTRARVTLSRPLVSLLSRIPLGRVIEEQLSRVGPVIAAGEIDHPLATIILREPSMPAGDNPAEPAPPDKDQAEVASGRMLEEWMGAARAVIVILGRVECLPRGFNATAERILWQKGIVVFPPVDCWELKSRWESFCRAFSGVASAVPISSVERGRAVLLMFRDEEEPLLVMADGRNEWDYQAAFQLVAEVLRRFRPRVLLKRGGTER